VKGSDFVASLPEQPGQPRDKLLLNAFQCGFYRPVTWSAIRLQAKDHQAIAYVSSDALAVGDEQDWVRINASHTLAQQIADVLGARLPTTKVCDEIHRQAALVIPPCIRAPDSQMMTTKRMADHNWEIQHKIQAATQTHRPNESPGLISTTGKNWVLTNRLLGNAEKGANYGWHDARGLHKSPSGLKLWQPLGMSHNRWYVDYSQTIRLVGPTVVVDGVGMDFDAVLQDPELCGVASYEGPLRLLRHPAVPVVADVEEPETLPRSTIMPRVAFIQAKHFNEVRSRQINWLVLHSMESPEKPGTAEAVANWFASEKAPQASAHFCVDCDSIVQCVLEKNIAWCAPGANSAGIHIEHAGYARQTKEQWLDDYGQKMLKLSAGLAANICLRYSIPVAFVDAEGLKRGERGITTHAEVSKAFKKSTHWDPGPGFPMDEYLGMVREPAHLIW